ncbi:MAG: FMN-binding protein [Clostridia bacterium]|nr:FMN-binding protein [Clostridia bacterium]
MIIRNLFNLITAWLSVVLLFVVVVIWVLRILVQKKIVIKDTFLFNANRVLRKYHKWAGIAFVSIALIHGILSSAELLSLNWGSACFFGIVIISLSYLIKQKMTRKIWLNIHRVLTISIVITFAVHLLDVGVYGLGLLRVPAALESGELSEDDISYLEDDVYNSLSSEGAALVLADGIYTGVADGFGPNLKVEVTILEGKIYDVTVVSHNEVNERFYSRPIEELPDAIVEAQSVQVDSISGATYTSIGIKNAVIDALKQAVVGGNLPDEEILIEADEHTSDGNRHGHGGGGGGGGGNGGGDGTGEDHDDEYTFD